MAQYHIIKQQTADIIFSDREKAPGVFEDVSRLFNNRIKDITETIFDAHVAEDVLIRIDTLEVDLGLLPYPFSEEQMAAKYSEALEAALSLKLREIKNEKGLQKENPETEISISVKTFLEHYLLTGTLPWWGSEHDMNDPEMVFDRLMQEEREALSVLIDRVGRKAYVRKRLVFGFTEKVIRDVIYLVEPGQAAFIIEYHKDISAIQKKEQLVKAEATEFEKDVWVFILDYLFDESGSYFNRKLFVRSTLRAMAAKFNLSFAKLLFLFNEAVNASGELLKYADALPSIIQELSTEMSYGASQNADVNELWEEPSLLGTRRNEKYAIISLYLLTGSFTSGKTHIERDYLISLFLELLSTMPQLMKELLLKLCDKESVTKRVACEFNDNVVKQVIKLIEPAGADFIINYSEVTLKIQEDKNMVKAEASVFKHVLWEFILTFLFSERGSVFNKRMFLESNIRQLAKHYNVEFNALLSFLAQGITEELSIISDNSSLFYMLIDILKETNHAYNQSGADVLMQTQDTVIRLQENKTEENSGREYEKARRGDADQVAETIFIRNLLLFWMEQGHLPWWADNQTTKSPEYLLNELIGRFPDEAVLLFRQAMMNRSISYTFFKSQSDAVFRIVQHMTDGKQALSYIELFKQLHDKLKLEYKQVDLPALLAFSVMQTYKESRFSSFNEDYFMSCYLKALAGETGLLLKDVAVTITTLFSAINTTQESVKIRELIRTAEPLLTTGAVFYAGTSGFSEEEVLRLIAPYPLHTTNGVVHFEDSAVAILHYFLRYNTLPDELKQVTGTQADELIFSLLLLLHKLNPASVLQLMAKDYLSSSAKMRVHDIFFAKTVPGTNPVKALLVTYLERDLLQFISEKGLSTVENGPGLKELIAGAMAVSNSSQRRSILLSLISSGSLVHYISRNYKGDAYFDALRAIGSEKTVALIKKVQYVFNFIAADSFERENLNLLLREFSFLWLAESANTNFSDNDFTRAFLKFLSQKRSWNMIRLSEQFSNVQKRSGVFIPADLVLFMAEMHKDVLYFAENKHYRELLQETWLKPSRELMKNSLEPMNKEEDTPGQQLPPLAGEEDTKKIAKELLLNEQIYIQNAGLILLHPFLSTFFSRTNLLSEGKFTNAAKQLRAPYLLQYAVTGHEDTTEHQLVLNKILSGIQTEEALPKITALTEHEKQVSHELLNVVIQQWDKVKNTSVEGFRASFLQRNGALTLTPEAWVLKIEQRGYDILLQTLPWGMGMIKTSWMDKPLIVEWI